MPAVRARAGDPCLFERRSRQRFSLALAVQNRTLGKTKRFGSGQTRTISSMGLLLELAEPEPLSRPIELWVSWPRLLDSGRALNLLVKERIVHSEGAGFAIVPQQHEFRTAPTLRWESKPQAFLL